MRWPLNDWYVALCSRELAPGRVVQRRVLDTPVALYRTANGSVAALRDRCPHRAVPLSMGRLCEDDQLMCIYHGLRFDTQGRCTHNPHGGGARPAALRVQSFPAFERYGLVWLWMGEAPANLARLPDLSILDADSRYSTSTPPGIRMNAPADLVIDNLLDLSHASFLHEGLLGTAAMVDDSPPKAIAGEDRLSVLRHYTGVAPPPFFDTIFKGDGAPASLWSNAHWQAPSTVVIDNGIHADGSAEGDGAHSYSLHALTPETPTTTLYHVAAALRLLPERRPAEAAINQELGKLSVLAFTQQDDPLVQAQFRAILEAEPGFSPALLSIDVGPVRWRRIMTSLQNARAEAVWTPVDGRGEALN